MADKKVTDLVAATTPIDGTELLPVVQGSASKKVATKEIAKFGYQDIVTETTSARTLSNSDVGAWVRFTSGSEITLTVPPNSSVAFIIGTSINGVQAGAGQISVVAGAGVTINKPTGYNAKTRAQGAAFCLIKVATDTWDLIGDLEAI